MPLEPTPMIETPMIIAEELRPNALEVPDSSPLLDTGESTASLPLQLVDDGDVGDRLEVEPIASFLEMAEAAGVSTAPTTIPGPATLDTSIELLTDASADVPSAIESSPILSSTSESSASESSAFELEPGMIAAGPADHAEDLPEASADAVEIEPKPITADIVPVGRAAEVRDQMLRFVSGEDQTPETQRYVLRVVTAMLLYEGMLDDDRLLHALEKLREQT
jgi:hypothetical protein